MRFPPVAAFLAGFIILLASITVRGLSALHALRSLEAEHPAFYAWLISPAVMNGTVLLALCLMAAGIGRIVLLHKRKSAATH